MNLETGDENNNSFSFDDYQSSMKKKREKMMNMIKEKINGEKYENINFSDDMLYHFVLYCDGTPIDLNINNVIFYKILSLEFRVHALKSQCDDFISKHHTEMAVPVLSIIQNNMNIIEINEHIKVISQNLFFYIKNEKILSFHPKLLYKILTDYYEKYKKDDEDQDEICEFLLKYLDHNGIKASPLFSKFSFGKDPIKYINILLNKPKEKFDPAFLNNALLKAIYVNEESKINSIKEIEKYLVEKIDTIDKEYQTQFSLFIKNGLENEIETNKTAFNQMLQENDEKMKKIISFNTDKFDKMVETSKNKIEKMVSDNSTRIKNEIDSEMIHNLEKRLQELETKNKNFVESESKNASNLLIKQNKDEFEKIKKDTQSLFDNMSTQNQKLLAQMKTNNSNSFNQFKTDTIKLLDQYKSNNTNSLNQLKISNSDEMKKIRNEIQELTNQIKYQNQKNCDQIKLSLKNEIKSCLNQAINEKGGVIGQLIEDIKRENRVERYNLKIQVDKITESFDQKLQKLDERNKILINSMTSVIIPDFIDKIEDKLFFNCSQLKEVNISVSVIKIGNFSFAGCSVLKKITIPQSVIEIGISAFSGCLELTEIIIPSSVTKLGVEVFEGCSSLRKVEFKDSSNIKVIPTMAFSNCKNLSTISLPSSITTIDELAFEECKSLYSIRIKSNVCVANNAFPSSTSLNRY